METLIDAISQNLLIYLKRELISNHLHNLISKITGFPNTNYNSNDLEMLIITPEVVTSSMSKGES